MRPTKKIPPKTKPQYALFVEGDCEYWYIQMLKRNEKCTNINLKPELPQKRKLSEQYNRVIELANDYDKVFWIVDFDVIIRETHVAQRGTKTALQELKEYSGKIENKYKDTIFIIINNPAFEYWHLLHFKQTSKYYAACNDVIKVLKEHLPNYEKTQKYYTKQNNDIYLQLKPYLSRAVSNAKKLTSFNFDNPETGAAQMHLFFDSEEIKNIIEKRQFHY